MRLLSLLAAVGAAVCLLTVGLAFVPGLVKTPPPTAVLVLLLGPMIVVISGTLVGGWRHGLPKRSEQLGFIRQWVPRSHLLVALAVGAAMVLVLVTQVMSPDSPWVANGSPGLHNGEYWLEDHGTWIRPVTQAELQRLSAVQWRLLFAFAGLWFVIMGVTAEAVARFSRTSKTAPSTSDS
jgi:hypothetical protein